MSNPTRVVFDPTKVVNSINKLLEDAPGLEPNAQESIDTTVEKVTTNNPEFFVAAIGDSNIYSISSYIGAKDEVVGKTEVRNFDKNNDPIQYLQSGGKAFNNMCLCKLESDNYIDTKKTVAQSIGANSRVSSLFWITNQDGTYAKDRRGNYIENKFQHISKPTMWFSQTNYDNNIQANGYTLQNSISPRYTNGYYVGVSGETELSNLGYTNYIEVDKELPTKWVITQTGFNPNSRVYPDRIYYKKVNNNNSMTLRMFLTHCAGTLGAYEGVGKNGINPGGFDAKNPDDAPNQYGVRPETLSQYYDSGNSEVLIISEEHLKSYVLNVANINALKQGVLVGNPYQPDPRLPKYRDIGIVRPTQFHNPDVDVLLENLFASGLTTYDPGTEYDYTQNGNIIPFIEYQYNLSMNPSITGPNDSNWKWYQDIFNEKFAEPLGLTSTFFYIDDNSYLKNNITDIQARYVKPRTFSNKQDSLAYDSALISYNGTPTRYGGPRPIPFGLYSAGNVPIETNENSLDLARHVASYSYIRTIRCVPQPGAWLNTSTEDQIKMLSAIMSGKDGNGRQFYMPFTLRDWKSNNFQQMSLVTILNGNDQRPSNGFGQLSIDGYNTNSRNITHNVASWGGGNLTRWGFNVSTGEWFIINRNVGPGRLPSVPVLSKLNNFSVVELQRNVVRPNSRNVVYGNSHVITDMEEFVKAVKQIILYENSNSS